MYPKLITCDVQLHFVKHANTILLLPMLHQYKMVNELVDISKFYLSLPARDKILIFTNPC